MKFLEKIVVSPAVIKGAIIAAASKSSMQRACAAAYVKRGVSIIKNPGISNDDLASLGVIQSLGATVESLSDGSLRIESQHLESVENKIDFGESGLGIRMFTPIVSLLPNRISIEGSGSLLQRPMNFFDEILPQLDVFVNSNAGFLPLQIQGPLRPKDITIDGSLSSQYLTGLLFAFASARAENVSIHVKNLKSRPYVDLTLKVLADFGLEVPKNDNYSNFTFVGLEEMANQSTTYQVEGDWSGAAFLLVAGAVAGNLIVKGLDVHSTQADKAVLEALQDTGCQLSIGWDQIEVGKVEHLKPFRFDATDCPDLFPPLVALAANCQGESVIEGVERLAHKESNRALTLQEEFAKLGIKIDLIGNFMKVYGGTGLKSTTVHSRNDHRIAMACAIAALNAEGEVTIENPSAINKSYPNFFEHLAQISSQNY